MGKALVLLATTCAALSTRPHTPTRRGFEVSTRKSRSDRITVLHYRDLDDYHVAANVENAAAAGSMNVSGVSTPTLHRAFSEIRPKSRPLAEDQIIMDEYLEFVERRYTRMMLKQKATTSKPVGQQSIFSPGNFIRSTLVYSSQSSHSPAARPDNEALRALGLANLASERLRQRLQAPRDFRNEHESAIHLFRYFANADKLVASVTESSGGRLSPHVGLGFLAQWKLLLRSLAKFLKAYVASLRVMANFVVRIVPAILERGGLRHSVRILSVASVAILLLFRPIVRGFIKRA